MKFSTFTVVGFVGHYDSRPMFLCFLFFLCSWNNSTYCVCITLLTVSLVSYLCCLLFCLFVGCGNV